MDQIGCGFAIDYSRKHEGYWVLWHNIKVKECDSYDAAYDFIVKVLKADQLELRVN